MQAAQRHRTGTINTGISGFNKFGTGYLVGMLRIRILLRYWHTIRTEYSPMPRTGTAPTELNQGFSHHFITVR